jgi:hypothetical protein
MTKIAIIIITFQKYGVLFFYLVYGIRIKSLTHHQSFPLLSYCYSSQISTGGKALTQNIGWHPLIDTISLFPENNSNAIVISPEKTNFTA